MPPTNTTSGSRVRLKPIASDSPSIVSGEYASNRRYPDAAAWRHACSIASAESNSASTPYRSRSSGCGAWEFMVAGVVRVVDELAHLENRNHRQEPNE